MVSAEVLERPLPKPSAEDYVSARLLEALVEAGLALEFLRRGLVRNAAGKAFQAWRALMAALLRLELERLKAVARSEEERRWLESTAVPRVPTSRMTALSQMLEEVGHAKIALGTALALKLHDYQYHGPDPDMALSKYRNSGEAAYDVVLLLRELAERAEALKGKAKWGEELEKALEELRRGLSTG
ncbi:PaREP1 domain containing protein [Thermoproteus uzoniensis 768-20]|uniref:PaREP1 domain containing protein n=1 Tax=Thermoproteus uzoniensis (strain 768-20) TaxID=999630 RepID=F2L5T7_THEU7|nr:PaREP1 family protein [Thermoproteus uzoniensis]AEA13633.1 PaREP1 domain containing protein [Thermoproteus uzoniensis 768-20]